MPKMKLIAAGWSTVDQIEEIRAKLALKGRDSKAYYDFSQSSKRANDQFITGLRGLNKERRITLAKSISGDKNVIANAFQNRREEKLSLLRHTATQAVQSMDQKVCEIVKTLNVLRYQGACKEQRLKDLKIRSDQLQLVADQQCYEDEVRRVRSLENALDKAKMKHDSAYNVQRMYQQVLMKLNEESLSYPESLRLLEQMLATQEMELRELTHMRVAALNAREQSKIELGKMEKQMQEWKRKRDHQLNAKRKNVERQKEMAAEAEKMATKTTIHTDDMRYDQKNMWALANKVQKHEKLLTLNDGFDAIKMATNATDVDEIVAHMLSQDATAEHLQNQRKEKEEERQKLLDNKEQKMTLFVNTKYTGEQKTARDMKLIDETREHLKEQLLRKQQLTEDLERVGSVLAAARIGVDSIASKLKDVKRHEEAGDAPVQLQDQLVSCEAAIEKLIANVGAYAANPDEEKLVRNMNGEAFQHFIEDKMPNGSVRVTFEEEGYSSDEYELDSLDNEDMLTRTDIKFRGQNKLESKQKKSFRAKKR